MDDPWGRGLPPAVTEQPPLPPRLAALAALTGPTTLPSDEPWRWPSAAELPEVRPLLADGWRPLDPAPIWACLPAVWPAGHRCWVRDRLPMVAVSQDDRGQPVLVPWDLADSPFASVEEDVAAGALAAAEECGLPAPPLGRLWLLRSPWPSLGLDVVLVILGERTGGLGSARAALDTARALLVRSEEETWTRWRGPTAEAARAWRGRGRVGEDVAALVVAGLGPEELATFTAGPPALTEAQAVAWWRAVGQGHPDGVQRVRAWLALGLPADPPPGLDPELADDDPAEVSEWLRAGFGLAEAGMLRGMPLAAALRWRDAGIAPQDARRLVDADETVTPAEARAFVAVGLGATDRVRWVEDGFDAAAARAWTDLDVLPAEARVWRSVGLGPAQAREHRLDGGPLPPGVEVSWFGYGGSRPHRRYDVVDPPGTRGTTAVEGAERRRYG